MTARALLHLLQMASAEVWIDASVVRYRAPRAVLTPEVVTAINEHRDDLLLLLASDESRDPEAIDRPAVPSDPDLPPSYVLREQTGWSIERFAQFCKELIRRPGPATAEQDVTIARLMLDYRRRENQ